MVRLRRLLVSSLAVGSGLVCLGAAALWACAPWRSDRVEVAYAGSGSDEIHVGGGRVRWVRYDPIPGKPRRGIGRVSHEAGEAESPASRRQFYYSGNEASVFGPLVVETRPEGVEADRLASAAGVDEQIALNPDFDRELARERQEAKEAAARARNPQASPPPPSPADCFACSFPVMPLWTARQYLCLRSVVSLDLWAVVIPSAILPGWRIARWARSRRRYRRGLCPQCGYDLRGTPDCCPECGAAPGRSTAGLATT